MRNEYRAILLHYCDLCFAELAALRSNGPHFRIVHRFHKPGTNCAPGEEIFAVYLVHRGREYPLRLNLALRILFDYLAHHSHLPQSATQIEAGIRASRFYAEHASNVMGHTTFTRSIPRSYVRVYIERLRTALEMAFQEAGLSVDPQTVLLKQETVMNEVGHRLRANFEWVHIII
jgi:hypothetical protein